MDELSTHFAHTSTVYDELPYDDHPIFRSHPSRIAATARLFGLDAVSIGKARVLELGCAAGGNIIPLAMFNPEAQFLGVDLGGRMIADGRARIAAAGLTNIELRHQSLTDLDENAGKFDYIIAHGIYSWVPEPVRKAILAICGRHLSEKGIAYVSYNVLPGWRMMQPLRDAFRLMIPADLPPSQRVKLGRGLIEYMAGMVPVRDAFGATLIAANGLLADHSDAYLFHEYMEDTNEPFAFSDFVADAGRHGLGYMAESELSVMFAERFEGDFAEKLGKSTRDDIVSYEQMLDILSGTSFRTTLLVRQERLSRIDRNLKADRMVGMHFIGSCLFTATRDGKAIELKIRGAAKRRYDDPAVVALLDRFFAHLPLRSLGFEELTAGVDGEALDTLLRTLLAIIVSGAIIVLDAPVRPVLVSERPKASPLAQVDGAMGRSETATRSHLAVRIDGLSRFILARLNGTHTPEELAGQLLDAIVSDEFVLNGPDGQTPAKSALPDIARNLIDAGLESLAISGLLDA